MKYNNAIFNYCLLLFIYVFIIFVFVFVVVVVFLSNASTVGDVQIYNNCVIHFFFFKIKVPSDISRRQILTEGTKIMSFS